MLENIDIQKILPHRYPFLLVDRVTELEDGKRAVGDAFVDAGKQGQARRVHRD